MGDNADNNTFKLHYRGGSFVYFSFHLHRGSASIDTESNACTSKTTWLDLVEAAHNDDVSSFDTLCYGALSQWWAGNYQNRNAVASCFSDFKAFVADTQ